MKGEHADVSRGCSVADLDAMIDYAHLLENHDMDSAAALECYLRAERMPRGSVDLRILSPLARLLHHHRGALDSALGVYRRAVVICTDALTLELRVEQATARVNQLRVRGSEGAAVVDVRHQDQELG
jgi:hypothetical protein